MRLICMRSRRAVAVLLAMVVLASLALMAGAAPALAAGTSMSVNPAGQSVNVGQSFHVYIDITSDQPILGGGVTVYWDPAASIQCTNVAKAPDFASAIGVLGTPNNTLGEISNTGLANLSPLPAGTYHFLDLTFTGASNGLVDVTLADVIVNDANANEIPGVTVNDGVVAVGQPLPAVDYVVTSKTEQFVQGSTSQYMITYTVHNQGTLSATVVTKTYVYVDDMGTRVAEYDCPALAVGGSDTQTVGPFTLSAGSDTIKVCADGSNLIAEGDEPNNCLTNQFPPPAGSMTVVPSASVVAVGQSFQVALNVSVGGSSLGAQSSLSWQLPEMAFCDAEALGPFYNSANVQYLPGQINNAGGIVLQSAVVNVGECETGSGDYLVYTFHALQEGTIEFDLSDVIVLDCDGNEIPGLTINGAQVVVRASCSTELAGNPVATIIIDCPEPNTKWSFRIGQNIYDGILNIRSNDSWRCDVADQDAATAGHMTEWDGMAYVTPNPKKLDSALEVRCTGEGTLVTLPTNGKTADGVVSGQAGDSGQDFDIEFIQDVEFDDAVLHGGHVYHIVVTFTAYVTA